MRDQHFFESFHSLSTVTVDYYNPDWGYLLDFFVIWDKKFDT